MTALLIIITLVNLSAFTFIAAVMVRRWRVGAANKWFFFMLLFGGLWVLDSFVQALLPQINNVLTHFNFAIAALTAGSVTAFALHYPKTNVRLSKNRLFIILIPIVIVAGLSFTDLFVKPITFKTVEPRPFYLLYFAFITIYFLFVPAISLLLKWKKAVGIPKLQVQTFLIGYLIAICIQLAESAYINLIGPLSVTADRIIINLTLPFIVFSAYSIVRYRFLDLRLTIQRGAIRVLTFLIVFGLYLLSILLIHESIRPQTRDGDVMFLVIVTLVVVLTVEPIRKFIFRKVDALFDSHEEKQRRMRERIKLAVTTQQTHEALMATALDIVRETAGVKDVSFVEVRDAFFHGKIATQSYLERYGRILVVGELPYRLEENEAFHDIAQELKDSGVGLLLPIGKGELFTGCFVLRSQQNNVFPSQTIQALKDLQFQISDAIIGARLYKQAVERIRV